MQAELKSVSVDGAVTERGTAFYMVFVESAEGDQQRRWAVAKRYSHFVDFRGKIEPLLTDIAPGMDQLPFPKKGWGTGTGSETVEERMSMFQTWIEAVCEVVLDEGLRAAGLPQVSQAYQQLAEFLKNDLSVSKETLRELGLHAPDQRRSHGPVVDPEDMNEVVRRQLLAAEEAHLPPGWQFNQPQPTDEEHAAAFPALSEAAQRARDGPFFKASSADQQLPAYQDTPRLTEAPQAPFLEEELDGRLVDGDGNQVTVTFCEQGTIGIQYMRATGAWAKGVNVPDRAAAFVIQEILPGSLASQQTSLHAGLILTKIDGVSIKGAHFEHSIRRMKGARPLKLTFEGIIGLQSASSVATPRASLDMQTPLSTGATPPLVSPAESDDETVWESTDESEPAVEPRLFAPELSRYVVDAVERSGLRGFFFCPADGCGDLRRFEIRALEPAEAAEGPARAVRYYAAPESAKPEWGFNADGDYIMMMGEVPERVDLNLVEEWYTRRNSGNVRGPSFVVRAGDVADVKNFLAASAGTGAEECISGADGGLGRVAALAAEILSSEQADDDLVVLVEKGGDSVAKEPGSIVAAMVLCNVAGGVAAVAGNDTDVNSIVHASADGAGASARVQIATTSAYRRRGFGELLLKIATGRFPFQVWLILPFNPLVHDVTVLLDTRGPCIGIGLTGVTMALGKAPAVEALVPRHLYSNADLSESLSMTDAKDPSVVRLLRREGYSEDLNLGEGEHARLLLVLHASMRQADVAPLEDEEADGVEQTVPLKNSAVPYSILGANASTELEVPEVGEQENMAQKSSSSVPYSILGAST